MSRPPERTKRVTSFGNESHHHSIGRKYKSHLALSGHGDQEYLHSRGPGSGEALERNQELLEKMKFIAIAKIH